MTEPTPTIRRGVRGGKARENAKWANEEDESDNTEWVDEGDNGLIRWISSEEWVNGEGQAIEEWVDEADA